MMTEKQRPDDEQDPADEPRELPEPDLGLMYAAQLLDDEEASADDIRELAGLVNEELGAAGEGAGETEDPDDDLSS